jgi:hypothetical protein
MRTIRLLVVIALIFLPAASFGSERFDGAWLTKLTCPPKGNTEGYTWQFVSVIQNGSLHGERGTAGQPGYFAIDGPIAGDGSAKLTANGIVGSKEYARGVFVREGANYTWDVKAQFQETTGTGTKGQGLGIVGRTCTFEFTKQPPAIPPAAQQPAGPRPAP